MISAFVSLFYDYNLDLEIALGFMAHIAHEMGCGVSYFIVM